MPKPGTFSLDANKGYLRLYLKPDTFQLRRQYSLMGIRQKESDFEYSAKMTFTPQKEKAEAGISIYQEDDNYINFTMEKMKGENSLKLLVKGRDKDPGLIKQETITSYKGEIVFKLISKNNKYQYLYSLDAGVSFTLFAETVDNLVICKGYIGTNIGVYATSNGSTTNEYADFDWVQYKGYPRF